MVPLTNEAPRRDPYAGLVHCKRCDARYRFGGWVSARRSDGNDTTGTAQITGNIRDCDCPICRKPPLL